MKTVTTRVDSDTHAKIDERAEESDRTRSAVARELIKQGLEYDDLENERDRLQRQLTATNQRNDDVNELVEFVEDEKLRRQQERERQRERENAAAWTRAKWWLFGRDRDGAESKG